MYSSLNLVYQICEILNHFIDFLLDRSRLSFSEEKENLVTKYIIEKYLIYTLSVSKSK